MKEAIAAWKSLTDVSALLLARNSMLLHGSTKEKGDQVKNAYLREDSLAHEFLHIWTGPSLSTIDGEMQRRKTAIKSVSTPFPTGILRSELFTLSRALTWSLWCSLGSPRWSGCRLSWLLAAASAASWICLSINKCKQKLVFFSKRTGSTATYRHSLTFNQTK